MILDTFVKKTKASHSFTISLDMEDARSPVVLIMQDGEATIYLTLKEVAHLQKELERVGKRFQKT